MWCRRHCVALLAALWLMAGAVANPVRRAPGDLEARRRSAVDRSIIRLGRSPPELTAADIREAFQRSTRRSNSFIRLGRAQPIALTTDDLMSILRAYSEDDDSPITKRVSNFVRLGRDNKFIRLGRSSAEEKPYEQASDLAKGYTERKNRARDHFIRLGRDSEEVNDADDEEFVDEERRKRSTESDSCAECQS